MGLNATTSHDATKYYCSLPANKLELWFALEAERFQVKRSSTSDNKHSSRQKKQAKQQQG